MFRVSPSAEEMDLIDRRLLYYNHCKWKNGAALPTLMPSIRHTAELRSTINGSDVKDR